MVTGPNRGTSTASEPVAMLLAHLGVTTSLLRPHRSNDNPYSESQCKALNYWPEVPDRFAQSSTHGSLCQVFLRSTTSGYGGCTSSPQLSGATVRLTGS